MILLLLLFYFFDFLVLLINSQGNMPEIVTYWNDFEISVNATHCKPFGMLDASL